MIMHSNVVEVLDSLMDCDLGNICAKMKVTLT
jgi:hypothetical protein